LWLLENSTSVMHLNGNSLTKEISERVNIQGYLLQMKQALKILF
jgi:hypothetical protein